MNLLPRHSKLMKLINDYVSGRITRDEFERRARDFHMSIEAILSLLPRLVGDKDQGAGK